MDKRIYRSNSDKILGGVCAGLAEYVDIDPTIIRVIWAVAFISGFGFLAYLIAWIVIPEKPYNIQHNIQPYNNQQYNTSGYTKESEYRKESENNGETEYSKEFYTEDKEVVVEDAEYVQNEESNTYTNEFKQNSAQGNNYNNDRSDNTAKAIGIVMILIGGLYLAKKLLSFINIDDKLVISAVLVIVGLVLITKKK